MLTEHCGSVSVTGRAVACTWSPGEKSWAPGDVMPSRIDELGLKCAAKCLLRDRRRHVTVPSEEQWVGMNLLIRDDEL